MDIDFELIKKFNAGNEESFDALVSKYAVKVYGLIYSFVHNSHDAEDLSQELWLIIYRSLKKFQYRSLFYTWLYRITINLCNRFLKNRKRIISLSEEVNLVHNQHEVGQLEKTDSKEVFQEITNSINKLPNKQKIIFVLRNYHNLSYSEISQVMNISVSSAKTNHFYAVKKLQKLISGDTIQ